MSTSRWVSPVRVRRHETADREGAKSGGSECGVDGNGVRRSLRCDEYGRMSSDRSSILRVRSVAPVFSTSDVSRWLEHYGDLGFTVQAHDETYGFASLGPVELHVSLNPDHDPLRTAAAAFVRVDDADAVFRRWSTVPGGRDAAPVDTDYGIREGAHIDPDGNLLRYGSEA